MKLYFILFLFLCLFAARKVPLFTPSNTDSAIKLKYNSISSVSLYNPLYLLSPERVTVEYCTDDNIDIVYAQGSSNVCHKALEYKDNIDNLNMLQYYQSPRFLYTYTKKDTLNQTMYDAIYNIVINGINQDEAECTEKTFYISKYGDPGFLHVLHNRWIHYIFHPYDLVDTTPEYCIGIAADRNANTQLFISDLSKPQQYYYTIIFSIGVLLYVLCNYIGTSKHIYMLLCCVLGCVLSIVMITLLLLYFVSKQISVKNWISSSLVLFALIFSGNMGWKVFNDYNSTFMNQYVLGTIVLGGLIGFYTGYTRELNEKQRDLLTLTCKVVGVVCIVHTVQLYEASIMIILLFSTPGQMLMNLLRIQIYRMSTPIIRIVYMPKRKLISVEQYRNNCDEATRTGIEELREYIRNNPSELSKLSESTYEYMRKFMGGDDHIMMILGVMNEKVK